ncbi:MAG: group III truncated hemoglobin [Chitinophagaceae bacterium]
MKEMNDILTVKDIKKLVDAFYIKVKQDELLAPVFYERIQGDWQPHLEKMYSFWQTVLLEDKTYFGSPFPPHAQLPIEHAHFHKWLQLFADTIDTLFRGEKAKEAKWRAEKMAEMFESKINFYKKQGFKNLL